MKPPPGRYRLTPVPPKPGTSMDIVVDETGCDTPYGRMTWFDPPGLFKRVGTVPTFGLIFDALNAGRYILGGDYDPFAVEPL